jgi:hypothetical protein
MRSVADCSCGTSARRRSPRGFGSSRRVLTHSIIDAENKTADAERACVRVGAARLQRESNADVFAAADAVHARKAELLQLEQERIQLRQQSGLSRAQRKALLASLDDRVKLTTVRYRNASKALSLPRQDPLLDAMLKEPHDVRNIFFQEIGCLTSAR